MISVLIICITIVFCIIYITQWARNMSKNNLPMFTYGECLYKVEDVPTTAQETPIGFEAPAEDKKLTDQEKKDELLADPVMMCAALLRGEVDVDELTNTRR